VIWRVLVRDAIAELRLFRSSAGVRYDPAMVERDRRDVTVLVLGKPGQTSRRFRFNRRVVGLVLLVLLVACLVIGYVLGNRHAAGSRSATLAAREPGPSAQVAVEPRSAPPREPGATAVAVAAVDASVPPAQAPAEQATAAIAVPSVDGVTTGESLQIVRGGQQGDQVIELHPFAADGSPRASDFDMLKAEMACGSGHSQAPDPELVRVLIAAQHHFAKPLVLIGGRCPAHDDHPDTVNHHRSGRAVDLRVRGVSSDLLMSWMAEHGVGGAGRYRRAGYVHIDLRNGPRERWQASEPVPAQKVQPQAQAAEPSPAEEATPAAPAGEATAPATPPAATP
jgi:hypothetical protein